MKWVITGGAGFIGINAAHRLLHEGHDVVLLDNFSRAGAARNLEWLQSQGHSEFEIVSGDIRDFSALARLFRQHADADAALHLAGQVAVTSSVMNPRADFEINALGTFNVLEAIRQHAPQAVLVNASTNKVYGQMEHAAVRRLGARYGFADLPFGVSEEAPLDFHSPYGCSKGAADQYVRDYARIYGLRTVTFRQSCIYGPRQFGIEDQGWVAWFAICATLRQPLTICGDGCQVRDLLFVEDLVEAYVKAVERIETASGQCYNIGGGPRNAASILEVISLLERFTGETIERRSSGWRPGDQRVFVCDVRKAQRDLGWEPRVGVESGVGRLASWVAENRDLFTHSPEQKHADAVISQAVSP